MYCVGTWTVVRTFFFLSFLVTFLSAAPFSASLTAKLCLIVSNRCLKEGRASDSFSVNSFIIMLAGHKLEYNC